MSLALQIDSSIEQGMSNLKMKGQDMLHPAIIFSSKTYEGLTLKFRRNYSAYINIS
jgi:hypothetical protein